MVIFIHSLRDAIDATLYCSKYKLAIQTLFPIASPSSAILLYNTSIIHVIFQFTRISRVGFTAPPR